MHGTVMVVSKPELAEHLGNLIHADSESFAAAEEEESKGDKLFPTESMTNASLRWDVSGAAHAYGSMHHLCYLNHPCYRSSHPP